MLFIRQKTASLSCHCVRLVRTSVRMERVVDMKSAGEDSSVKTALAHLQRGDVVAFPTDTIYGVSCLAQNTSGIRQLYAIKRRDAKKPIAICVGNVSEINKYAVCDGLPQGLLDSLLPGAVTVVLQRRPCLNPELNPEASLVGVRVPDHPLSRHLAQAANEPLALTSANISSEPSCVRAEEFSHLWPQLGVVLDGGVIQPSSSSGGGGEEEPSRKGSTVVDLSDTGVYRIIRPGCALESTERVLHSYGWKEK
ncbi:threonylcarbamoyl-AMP synthase-like [Sycon ciliatum]|uniref:threonylcarbamoyl-AMP synthase-like n=1 Tax=Sycon ciliatum TaxID=27933 RepID=UPI0031F6AE12